MRPHSVDSPIETECTPIPPEFHALARELGGIVIRSLFAAGPANSSEFLKSHGTKPAFLTDFCCGAAEDQTKPEIPIGSGLGLACMFFWLIAVGWRLEVRRLAPWSVGLLLFSLFAQQLLQVGRFCVDNYIGMGGCILVLV